MDLTSKLYENIGQITLIVIIAAIAIIFLMIMGSNKPVARHGIANGRTNDVWRLLNENRSYYRATQPRGRHRRNDEPDEYTESDFENYDDDEFETFDGTSGYENTSESAPSSELVPSAQLVLDPISTSTYNASQYLPEGHVSPSYHARNSMTDSWWRTEAGDDWLKPVTMEDFTPRERIAILNSSGVVTPVTPSTTPAYFPSHLPTGEPSVIDMPVSPAPTNYAPAPKTYAVGRHSVLIAPGTDSQRALLTGTMEMAIIEKHELGLKFDSRRELVAIGA